MDTGVATKPEGPGCDLPWPATSSLNQLKWRRVAIAEATRLIPLLREVEERRAKSGGEMVEGPFSYLRTCCQHLGMVDRFDQLMQEMNVRVSEVPAGPSSGRIFRSAKTTGLRRAHKSALSTSTSPINARPSFVPSDSNGSTVIVSSDRVTGSSPSSSSPDRPRMVKSTRTSVVVTPSSSSSSPSSNASGQRPFIKKSTQSDLDAYLKLPFEVGKEKASFKGLFSDDDAMEAETNDQVQNATKKKPLSGSKLSFMQGAKKTVREEKKVEAIIDVVVHEDVVVDQPKQPVTNKKGILSLPKKAEKTAIEVSPSNSNEKKVGEIQPPKNLERKAFEISLPKKEKPRPRISTERANLEPEGSDMDMDETVLAPMSSAVQRSDDGMTDDFSPFPMSALPVEEEDTIERMPAQEDFKAIIQEENAQCLVRCSETIKSHLDWANGSALCDRQSPFNVDMFPPAAQLHLFSVMEEMLEQLILDEDRHHKSNLNTKKPADLPFDQVRYQQSKKFRMARMDKSGEPIKPEPKLVRVPFMPRERMIVNNVTGGKQNAKVDAAARQLRGRSVASCDAYSKVPRSRGDYDIWYLDPQLREAEEAPEKTKECVWALDRTRQTVLTELPTLSLYRLSHVISDTSGSVMDLAVRRNEDGTRLFAGCAALDSFNYNRSRNIIMHDLESKVTTELCAHMTPVDQTSYINSQKVWIPLRSHPRNLDFILCPPSDLFYSSVMEFKLLGNEYMASAGNDGAIAIWSTSGSLLRLLYGNSSFKQQGQGYVYEVAESIEADAEMFGDNDDQLKHRKASSEEEKHRPPPSDKKEIPHTNRLTIHPREQHLFAACMNDGSMWLWDARGYNAPSVIEVYPEKNATEGHCFSLERGTRDDLSRIGMLDYFSAGRLCSVTPKRACVDAVFGTGITASKLFACYETSISSGSGSGQIQCFDITTQQNLGKAYDAPDVDFTCMSMSKSGTFFAAGSLGDGILRLFDATEWNGEAIMEMKNEQTDVNVVTISPCEMFLATGGTDNKIYLYDRRFNNRPLFIFEHENPFDTKTVDGVNAVTWASNSKYVYSGGSDGMLRIWDPKHGDHPLVHQMASSDGGAFTTIAPVREFYLGEWLYDESTLCCGTETGKVCVFTQDQQLME